jgi:hypothetical protein
LSGRWEKNLKSEKIHKYREDKFVNSSQNPKVAWSHLNIKRTNFTITFSKRPNQSFLTNIIEYKKTHDKITFAPANVKKYLLNKKTLKLSQNVRRTQVLQRSPDLFFVGSKFDWNGFRKRSLGSGHRRWLTEGQTSSGERDLGFSQRFFRLILQFKSNC